MEKNYLLSKDYNKMKELANVCIKIDENRGECYWYLGIAEIFLGEQEEGKKHIQESKDKYYGNPAYIQLAAAYLSQKNYKDATVAYQNLVAIYPQNASYHSVLALLYREVGQYERARMEAMDVFRLRPEDPEIIAVIRLLLGINPNDLSLHSSLATIYKQLGRKEEMRKELLILASAYQQAIAKNPKNPYNHFSLAGIYKELEEYDKAYREAILTIESDPDSIKKVEGFIQLLPAKFLDAYGEYLRSNPDKYFKAYGKYPDK